MNDSLERKYLDRSGGYSGARDAMRVVGPLLIVVAAIFLIIGLVGIVGSFGTHRQTIEFNGVKLDDLHYPSDNFGPPKNIWCMFVGMPLLAIGIAITRSGYMSEVARYEANQIAPVGKDVVNYMAEGAQESVKALTRSVAEGLREGMGEAAMSRATVHCPKCHAANGADAKFCDQCGAAMTIICGGCGASNQAGSIYCNQCGKALA